MESSAPSSKPAVTSVIRCCWCSWPATPASRSRYATAFTAGASGRDEVLAEERRLRGLGVEGVPNLLLNSRVLVPGAADVATYIQALDQALFPENPAQERQRLLH